MLKTMAVQISENNYDIAAACLPGGFALYPLKNVLGCYLVINELDIQHFKKEGNRPYLTVSNSWETAERFHEKYSFMAKETPDKFVEVCTK